jgi:hypothetical protein
MRLRPLVTALVVWMASLSASNAAETPSGPPLSASPPRVSSDGSSLRRFYFGVMGEVARPGTYSARGVWTLAELIKKAGGITREANKTVRIFRGGVLTEQVFLGSGETPPLSPNDLIVVGTNQDGSHIAPAEPDHEVDVPAVSAVQLAFVNLLDRPIIVKMPSEQATLPRIVEALGQPAESSANVRVFPPLGASPRDVESAEEKPRPLESGTVLVFAPGSVHADALPAFPAPIAETLRTPKSVVAKFPPGDSAPHERPLAEPSPSDTKTVEIVHPKSAPANSAVLSVAADRAAINQTSRPIDILPHVDVNPRSPQPAVAAEPDTRAARLEALVAHPTGQRESESHAARTILVMAVMSAIAGLAMLLTFISIGQRWLASGKIPFSRHPGGTSAFSRLPASGVPVPPVPAGLIRRPIRIDAGQPITRLSVDLAALERVTQAKSSR